MNSTHDDSPAAQGDPLPRSRRRSRLAGMVATLLVVVPALAAASSGQATATDQVGQHAVTIEYLRPWLEDEGPTEDVAPHEALLADDPARGFRVQAVGDVASAERIVVLVPGASNDLATFDKGAVPAPGIAAQSPLTQARALYADMIERDPTTRVATIAWLGYAPPAGATLDALDEGPAEVGARNLEALQSILPPQAHVTWNCHSYGTMVCAKAAAHSNVDDIVLIGSPGTSFGSVAAMRTDAQVWALRAQDDPIRFTTLLNLIGLGLGPDPLDDGFGATVLPQPEHCGHSGYYEVGSSWLGELARIGLDQR